MAKWHAALLIYTQSFFQLFYIRWAQRDSTEKTSKSRHNALKGGFGGMQLKIMGNDNLLPEDVVSITNTKIKHSFTYLNRSTYLHHVNIPTSAGPPCPKCRSGVLLPIYNGELGLRICRTLYPTTSA
jgi:hypothetical protein